MNKRPTYEPYELVAQETGQFSRRHRRAIIERNRWHVQTGPQGPARPPPRSTSRRS